MILLSVLNWIKFCRNQIVVSSTLINFNKKSWQRFIPQSYIVSSLTFDATMPDQIKISSNFGPGSTFQIQIKKISFQQSSLIFGNKRRYQSVFFSSQRLPKDRCNSPEFTPPLYFGSTKFCTKIWVKIS